MVVVLSGHRSIQVLGPMADRGQNDVSILQEFMTLPGGSAQPRGMVVMGSGFGESETADHSSFLSTFMKATVRHPDYASFTGNSSPTIDLIVQPPVAAGGAPKTYGVLSSSLDVFTVVVAAPAGQVGAYYENVGAGGPFVGSVYGPNSGGVRPFKTILNGFAVADLTDGDTGFGRKTYVSDLLTSAFGDLSCAPVCIIQCTDVAPQSDDSAFLSLSSNPARGSASIRLVMPKSERAKVAIYDVTGRRLKTLADGLLAEGPQSFVWDGTDERGGLEAAGVYWVRVGTASGTHASKTFVLLR